jgi:hypothetical protein
LLKRRRKGKSFASTLIPQGGDKKGDIFFPIIKSSKLGIGIKIEHNNVLGDEEPDIK